MSAGEETIHIENLSHDGKGVGRLERDDQGRGKACFIAGALPGESVRWRLTQSKRSFDEGELVEILEPSPDRVAPRCEHIRECGGCELQHLDPGAQLVAKQDQLKGAFSRENIEPGSWLAPLAGSPWKYRRRTRLAVAYVGTETLIGYRQRSSRKIADIDSCVVLESSLGDLIQPLKPLVSGLKRLGLDQIELVAGDDQIAICLSIKRTADDQSLKPLEDFCVEQSIQLWIREGRAIPEPRSQYEPLTTTLSDELSMQFTPAQFVQTNAEMNRKMIEQAMQLLDIKPEHSALDLFCGAGNFSLPMAQRARTLLGLEGLPDLIAQADMNVVKEGLENASFNVVDLSKEGVLSGKQFAIGTFDRILLDPPRTGAKNLVPALIRLAAPRLVYISCHPATLVRDAKNLIEGGYTLSKAGVIDMFPQTTHLEAVALFEQ